MKRVWVYSLWLYRGLTNARWDDAEKGKLSRWGSEDDLGERQPLDAQFSAQSFVEKGEDYSIREEGTWRMVSKVDRSFDATANETRIVLVSYQDLKGMIPVLAVSPVSAVSALPAVATYFGYRQNWSWKSNSSCMQVLVSSQRCFPSYNVHPLLCWRRRLQVPRLSRQKKPSKHLMKIVVQYGCSWSRWRLPVPANGNPDSNAASCHEQMPQVYWDIWRFLCHFLAQVRWESSLYVQNRSLKNTFSVFCSHATVKDRNECKMHINI